tara:strand:+ start:183 stop:437 length:255 start_codon:yes stop_codon:yes gene_type:complete
MGIVNRRRFNVSDCYCKRLLYLVYIKRVTTMDGINDELNNLIDEEVRQAKAIKQAKKIVDTRRPLTRAKIQEIKDMLQLGKDFE